jgi:integrase
MFEAAIRDQLAPALRPLFAFSLHTGVRWSEQAALCWGDVDMLAGIITIGRAKNGHSRRVPINSTVAGPARRPWGRPDSGFGTRAASGRRSAVTAEL